MSDVCMCVASDDESEPHWRPCPPSLCERTDHDHGNPNFIGRKATIVGHSIDGAPDQDFVAHICLDIEDGPRVFFQATDPKHIWRIVEEER